MRRSKIIRKLLRKLKFKLQKLLKKKMDMPTRNRMAQSINKTRVIKHKFINSLKNKKKREKKRENNKRKKSKKLWILRQLA